MQKGFTLIELIIVITIIGIIITFGIGTYTQVQRRARDAKRVSDINSVIKAIKIYRIQTGTYPGDADDAGVRVSNGCTSDLINDLVNRGYLDSAPTDPWDNGNCSDINDTSYFYGFDDAHCCEASTCISINRLETQEAFDLLDRQHSGRLIVSNGCNANIGNACTTERQFHYCFVPN